MIYKDNDGWKHKRNHLNYCKIQLTDFLQNPQNPPRTLPVHDVIHISKSQFSILDFYFYICEWHILPARALTPALKFALN